MADHSKFSSAALSIPCALHDIDCIVTDDRVNAHEGERVHEHGSQLIQV